MRALMLSRLPADLTRLPGPGCGLRRGAMTAELAARGADVVAVDISPALVEIAQDRLPEAHACESDLCPRRHDGRPWPL